MCVSGEAEFTSHHNDAKQLAESLCYFMAKKTELSTPPASNDFVVHYVKVVEGNVSPKSVDCLLFTSGKHTIK